MIKENVGESVFGNADEVLAEKIISRSEKNSREPRQAFTRGGDGSINNASGINNTSNTSRINRKRNAIIKIAIPIALAALVLWILTRGRKG